MSIEDLYKLDNNTNKVVYVKKSSVDIAKSLHKSKPQIKQPLDFTKISNLTDETAKEIQKHLESEVGTQHFVIGGSAAAETQVARHRNPKDLDLHAKNVRREANHIATILKHNYSAKNVQMNPMIRFPDGTRMIQIKLYHNGEWIDAVDIKSIVKPGTNLPSVNIHTKVPIKIGKLYYEQVGELIARKASAIQQNCGKYPKPRCKKDLADFLKLSKSVATPKQKIKISELERNLSKSVKTKKNDISKLWTL